MGGSKSKPVELSARTVISNRKKMDDGALTGGQRLLQEQLSQQQMAHSPQSFQSSGLTDPPFVNPDDEFDPNIMREMQKWELIKKPVVSEVERVAADQIKKEPLAVMVRLKEEKDLRAAQLARGDTGELIAPGRVSFEVLMSMLTKLRDQPDVSTEHLSEEFHMSEESILAVTKCAYVEEIYVKTEAEKRKEEKDRKWVS